MTDSCLSSQLSHDDSGYSTSTQQPSLPSEFKTLMRRRDGHPCHGSKESYVICIWSQIGFTFNAQQSQRLSMISIKYKNARTEGFTKRSLGVPSLALPSTTSYVIPRHWNHLTARQSDYYRREGSSAPFGNVAKLKLTGPKNPLFRTSTGLREPTVQPRDVQEVSSGCIFCIKFHVLRLCSPHCAH